MIRKLIALSIVLCTATIAGAQSFSAYDLRCEYLSEPLAINTATPKFSWKAASDTRAFTQDGYEIVVGEKRDDVACGKGNMWNTGKVAGEESLHVAYKGKALKPGKMYWWSVRLYDIHGKSSPWSATAGFRVGLLDTKDWSGAQWIAMEIMPEEQRIVPGVEYKNLELMAGRTPGINKLPQFRKEIEVQKAVKSAMAYVCGIGQFEFFLNGEKVGDHFMDPAWTNFDNETSYVPFDVTDMVSGGRNVLGVMLGNGFISVPWKRYFKGFISYCYPKMIMKLVIEYADGSTDVTVSDRSWKTAESPVTYSSIFGGEDYDATKFLAGWMKPGYDDESWQDVLIAPQPAVLTAQIAHPVKVMEQFLPVTVRKTRHGKWLYDLGQNFSGTVRLTVKGKRGQSVTMNTSELFNTEADSITITGGYRGEYRLTYTIGEDGRSETWNPQFTYFGQRYVLVGGAVPHGEENPDGLPMVEEIIGLHLRNSTATVGNFECSNDLMTKTHNLIEWGIKGNMVSFLTDCPHREKLPWIEQLHLMFGSLQYNFDTYKLYEKMVGDMAQSQWDNGLIPDVTPMYFMFRGGFVDSPEWGSSFILSPLKIYEYYGDISLLRRHYGRMKRYLEYLEEKSDGYILSHGLGDWYDIGPNPPGISQHTSLASTATPIFYMDAMAMKKAAELTGNTGDIVTFTRLAENIRRVYNEKFYHAQEKYYDRNSQCANAIAIYAGLAPEGDIPAIVDNIVKDVRARGNALSAGDVGYNYVLRILESYGHSDVIYDMNSRYNVYGYGYMLGKGATALPETWNALPEKSHNHFMLGHLQEWLYSQLGGIQKDQGSLAYKNITIKPAVVGDVTWARTDFESPYGTIATDWEKTTDEFTLSTEIPANTTATVWLPADRDAMVTESGLPLTAVKGVTFLRDDNGYKVYVIGSGRYRFRVQ